jgi:hypothetical protein
MSEASDEGSLIDDALRYIRQFERLAPPAIDDPASKDAFASLRESPDLDDLIAGAPHVRVGVTRWSTASLTPLELHRPHPHIEGLLAFQPVTAKTIAMRPGLRFVQLAGSPITPEIQAALPATLEELWAEPLDLDMLGRLPRLRLLHTKIACQRAAICRSLAGLRQLRVLRLESPKSLHGVEALGRLEHLRELRIERVARLDLGAFAGCQQLRSLNLGTSIGIEGIEALQRLERLSLGGRRAVGLAPLKGLPKLACLGIGSLVAPPDLEVVGELVNLRSLSMTLGSVSAPVALKGAAMFSNLKRLQRLLCTTLLENKDLTPLGGLAHLKYLAFWGAFPEKAVQWLQDRLPDCRLDLTIAKSPARERETCFGVLTAIRDDDGRWTVFQDLRLLLSRADNYAAEDAVKAHLVRANPRLLKRVTFDSEAHAFCVYAKSGDDIQSVADAVAALAAC